MHYNHLNNHIPGKLSDTVKTQTEISEKSWEGRMVVKIPNEWGGDSQGALSVPDLGLCPRRNWWWWWWWCSPLQCKELHSELDNLSDEYLSCLRKLQHCREELNQSQQLPPRVRGSILPDRPACWWDGSSFSQILQIKFISPCQHLASLFHSTWLTYLIL